MSEQKMHKLYVHGMHCPSCVVLTESELSEHPSVTSARSDLRTRTVEVCGDFGERSLEEVAKELNSFLSQHSLSVESEKIDKKWPEFKIAIPLALGFVLFFVLLQKLGIINLINAGKVTLGTSFVIGVVASLSTCMAVVGGLVLSMSAAFAKAGDKIKPQLLFHFGRITSFFILGGGIGLLGSAFTLNTYSTFVLSLMVGLIMLLLGINLLDIFPKAKGLQLVMPKFISRRVISLSKFNHSFTPLLLGILTFFLPCGFTQSMQVFALSTGSFLSGGLTMLAFALGTLPVLALVSFSSFSIKDSSKSGVFFKTAGLIVILFSLFNIINSLVIIGILPPIFNF